MSLKTLEHVKEIGGYKVNDATSESLINLTPEEWREYEKTHPIFISHKNNEITFKIQKGVVSKNGINGCQVDTIIEAAKLILEGLNEQHYCYQNDMAINKLECALYCLRDRTADRVQRGVEGTSHE